MKWLSLFIALIKLALMVLKRFERQRILEEGKVRTIRHLMEKANAIAKAAQDARDAVSTNPYDWVRDKYNRTPNNEDSSV